MDTMKSDVFKCEQDLQQCKAKADQCEFLEVIALLSIINETISLFIIVSLFS